MKEISENEIILTMMMKHDVDEMMNMIHNCNNKYFEYIILINGGNVFLFLKYIFFLLYKENKTSFFFAAIKKKHLHLHHKYNNGKFLFFVF